ncbi:MAG: peptidylprolyl isomerase [Verrucomicrobiales bacterium]|jgi:parvulin-like peptidyl-prolyl isomerase
MPLKINGESVDNALLDAEFSQIKAHFERQANVSCCERDDEFMGYAKDNIIARVLLSQKALEVIDEPGSDAVDARLDTLKKEYGSNEEFYFKLGISEGQEDEIRGDIAGSIRVDSLISRIVGELPSPGKKQLRGHYEENIKDFMSPEEVRALHIFKSLSKAENRENIFAELREVRSAALAGEDFMTLVKKHSDKPEEEADLGWYKRGELMDEFELITFSMEINEISPVFATQWGIHLAKLSGRRPPEPIPFEELQDEITERINAEESDTKLNEYVAKLKDEAEITDVPEAEG